MKGLEGARERGECKALNEEIKYLRFQDKGSGIGKSAKIELWDNYTAE